MKGGEGGFGMVKASVGRLLSHQTWVGLKCRHVHATLVRRTCLVGERSEGEAKNRVTPEADLWVLGPTDGERKSRGPTCDERRDGDGYKAG